MTLHTTLTVQALPHTQAHADDLLMRQVPVCSLHAYPVILSGMVRRTPWQHHWHLMHLRLGCAVLCALCCGAPALLQCHRLGSISHDSLDGQSIADIRSGVTGERTFSMVLVAP